MNVAHGTWLPEMEGLFVWAETSPSSSTTEPSESKTAVLAHPYQLDTERIPEEILVPLSGSDIPSEAERASLGVVMSMPTAARSPLPSPELGVDEEATAASLETWRVNGIVLSPAAALSWLVTLPAADEIDKERLHVGADLVYWSLAARFALELLA